MTKAEIRNIEHTIAGLCKLAWKLGYKDPHFEEWGVSNCADGSVAIVTNMISFFKDNPRAVEAVINWVGEELSEG